MKITDQIKSFEDACKMHPPTPEQQKALDSGYEPAITTTQLDIIAKALKTNPDTGEVSKLDLKSGKARWFPVFNVMNGFSFFRSFGSDTGTSVGSRHEFETEELSDYFGTQFLEIHKAHKTIQQ